MKKTKTKPEWGENRSAPVSTAPSYATAYPAAYSAYGVAPR